MGVMPDNRAFPNSLLGWPGMNRPPSQRRGIDRPTVETSPAVPSMRCRYRSRTSPIVNATPSHTRDRGGIAEPVASFLAGSRRGSAAHPGPATPSALRRWDPALRAALRAVLAHPNRYALTGYPDQDTTTRRGTRSTRNAPPHLLLCSPSQALATTEARAWLATPSPSWSLWTWPALQARGLGSRTRIAAGHPVIEAGEVGAKTRVRTHARIRTGGLAEHEIRSQESSPAGPTRFSRVLSRLLSCPAEPSIPAAPRSARSRP